MLTYYFIPDSLVNYVRFLIVISSVYVYFLILAELIVATLAQCMVDKKGNIEANLLASIHSRNPAAIKILCKNMLSCLKEQGQKIQPESGFLVW